MGKGLKGSASNGGKGKGTKKKGQKKSDYEKAEYYQKMSLVSRMKGTKNEIDRCLEDHPEVISDVRQFLVDKHLLPSAADSATQKQWYSESGPSSSPIKNEPHSDVKEEEEEEEAGQHQQQYALAADDILDGQIPMNYVRFGPYNKHGLSAKIWRAIFARLEPVALGKFALAALIPPKRREICTDCAAEICERMTDLSEDTEIKGDLRDGPTLVAELNNRNEANGLPLANIPLDGLVSIQDETKLVLNWDPYGWYKLTNIDSNTSSLHSKFHGCAVVITKETLLAPPDFDLATLKLSKNFSKFRAELHDESQLRRKNCMFLFTTGPMPSSATPGATPQPVTPPNAFQVAAGDSCMEGEGDFVDLDIDGQTSPKIQWSCSVVSSGVVDEKNRSPSESSEDEPK